MHAVVVSNRLTGFELKLVAVAVELRRRAGRAKLGQLREAADSGKQVIELLLLGGKFGLIAYMLIGATAAAPKMFAFRWYAFGGGLYDVDDAGAKIRLTRQADLDEKLVAYGGKGHKDHRAVSGAPQSVTAEAKLADL